MTRLALLLITARYFTKFTHVVGPLDPNFETRAHSPCEYSAESLEEVSISAGNEHIGDLT